MKVFLCWSGERSKKVAEKLKDWLPLIIQAVEPWMSPDIEKGDRWSSEIANQLEKSKLGIICLTKENLDSRWILFESGALSKTKDARPCTFLLDIAPADVEPPLAQFMHTEYEKEDVLKLLQTINSKVKEAGEKAVSQEVLNNLFIALWPQLEQDLQAIVQQQSDTRQPMRSDSEKLDELLASVRGLGRQVEKPIVFKSVKAAEIDFTYSAVGDRITLGGSHLGILSLIYTFRMNKREKILEGIGTYLLGEVSAGVVKRFQGYASSLLMRKFPGYSIGWESMFKADL